MPPSSKHRREAVRLRRLIPRLGLTLLILRITQLLAVGYFSISYGLSNPDVYLDTLVWPKAATPPFEISVARNTSTAFAHRAAQLEALGGHLEASFTLAAHAAGNTQNGALAMNPCGRRSSSPACNETHWMASRMGWLDSAGTLPQPRHLADVVHMDRYIFGFVLAAVRSFL